MAIGVEKTNEQRQALYCDIGKHTIVTGEKYLTLATGHMSCPTHKDDEPLIETQLAGSLA